MLLHHPYDFKLLQSQRHSASAEHINRYIVIEYGYIRETQSLKLKDFATVKGVLKPVILYGGTDVEKDIPAFHHPLLNEKNNWLALDLRALVRSSDSGVQVRNASDYALSVSRFILSGLWLGDKQASMYTLKLAHIAYAEWLSTNLTRKFGLNITEQIKLFVLSALYYSHQFTDSFDADDLGKLKLRLQGEVFVESIIDEVAADAGVLNNTEDFCAACYRVTQSPRLQGLTFGVLVNVLSNNWFSTQGNELALLSLEHPPTWISLVSACLTSKSYRNSYISKVVEGKNKRGAGEDFLKGFNMLIGAQKGEI
jgi:hypothetical protein